MVGPGEKMVAIGHEMDFLGTRGGRNLIKQAGRIAADDLVVFTDQEDKLARVLPEASDNASGADIAGGSDEEQPLRLVGAGQGGNRACSCGEPQQTQLGTAMAAQRPGVSQGVINGPGQSIDGDLPVSIIPAGWVGEPNDGSDPLGLESLGEATIAERMRLGELAAFSVRSGIQPRVDDHEPRASCRMSRKLHVRKRAAAVASAQCDRAVASDAKEPSDGGINDADQSEHTVPGPGCRRNEDTVSEVWRQRILTALIQCRIVCVTRCRGAVEVFRSRLIQWRFKAYAFGKVRILRCSLARRRQGHRLLRR